MEVTESEYGVLPLAWAPTPPRWDPAPSAAAHPHTTVLMRLIGLDLELPTVLLLLAPPPPPPPGPPDCAPMGPGSCGASGESGVRGVRGVCGDEGGGNGECGGGGGMEERGGYCGM